MYRIKLEVALGRCRSHQCISERVRCLFKMPFRDFHTLRGPHCTVTGFAWGLTSDQRFESFESLQEIHSAIRPCRRRRRTQNRISTIPRGQIRSACPGCSSFAFPSTQDFVNYFNSPSMFAHKWCTDRVSVLLLLMLRGTRRRSLPCRT